jgi:hypothetical protein
MLFWAAVINDAGGIGPQNRPDFYESDGCACSVLDADEALVSAAERIIRLAGLELRVDRELNITPSEIPADLENADIAIIEDRRQAVQRPAPCRVPRQRRTQLHESRRLQGIGISVHTIKGYGDTTVAEFAIGLMWAAAKGFASMDREMIIELELDAARNTSAAGRNHSAALAMLDDLGWSKAGNRRTKYRLLQAPGWQIRLAFTGWSLMPRRTPKAHTRRGE